MTALRGMVGAAIICSGSCFGPVIPRGALAHAVRAPQTARSCRPAGAGTDEAGGYYFNGPDLIMRKTRLARELGLGGVMIWEVGQDCRQNAVTHGKDTHAVTCPQGEQSALLAALARERGPRDSDGGQIPPRDEL